MTPSVDRGMDQVLVFSLGPLLYGLEVSRVREIVESPALYYIPRAPRDFAGAMNFHGAVIPVLDLASFLGLAAEGRDHRVIVLSDPLCSLGLQVSAVHRIVPQKSEDLLPPLETGTRSSCARMLLRRGGDHIHLLDVARLLTALERPGETG